MSKFDDFCTDLGRFANKAAKKTGELAKSATLRIKLERVKNQISAHYEKLGRLTYKQLKTGEAQTEKIADVISKIDSLRVEEALLKKKIEEPKEATEEE